MRTKFYSEILKRRDHSVNVGVNGKIILGWILGKYDEKVWTGFIWLGIGINGGLL
jgi:hypothetical protein